MHRRRIEGTGLALLLWMIGCDASQPSGQESGPEASSETSAEDVRSEAAEILAEVTLGDGTKYTFLQVDEDEVAVAIASPSPRFDERALRTSKSLAQLYVSLRGEPAPRSILAADARVAAALGKAPDAYLDLSGDQPVGEARQEIAESGLGQQASSLTTSQFQNWACPANHDFLYCWPNVGR